MFGSENLYAGFWLITPLSTGRFFSIKSGTAELFFYFSGMKKHLLLSTFLWLLLGSSAQDIDKNLLTGKWKVHYYSVSDFTIDNDSIAYSAGQRVQAAIALAKEHHISSQDSLNLIEKTYYQGRQVDSSYFIFKKAKSKKVRVYFPIEDPSGKVVKGTYKWIDNNHAVLNLGEDPIQLTFVKLNTKHLEMIAKENQGPNERTVLRLTKQ